MAYTFVLPKDKASRESTIDRMVRVGEQNRNIHAVQWWKGYHYLQGARDFDVVNYETGEVTVSYNNMESPDEPVGFTFEGIIPKMQAQAGRLLNIDISPAVSTGSIGLDAMKKASTAQVILDAIMPKGATLKLKETLVSTLLALGTIGLGAWATEEDEGIEVIPPWELLPIPANNDVVVGEPGLLRKRLVPLDWVKNLANTPKPNSSIYNEVETTHVLYSNQKAVDDTDSGVTTSVADSIIDSIHGLKSSSSGDEQISEDIEMVEFVECWLYDESGLLASYGIWAGKKELMYKEYDHNIETERIYPPISIVRYYNTSGFWSRSYLDVLMPMNSEIEFMAASLFQNVEDMDLLGVLCTPTTLGIPSNITVGEDGIKRLPYEPDYMNDTLKPFTISPPNSGLAPIKTLETAMSMFESLSTLPSEMMNGGAPGRVDNSQAIGMILETTNMPLAPVATSIALGVSGCYRYLLGHAKLMWDTNRTVSIAQLDESIAGIKFDSDTGQMTLEKNAIPDPNEVSITIASQMPKSDEQMKAELQQALQAQIITPTEYRIAVRKKGLSLPVGNEIEWQNYRKATFENIIQFNDGQTPNKITVTKNDDHMLHAQILDAFMARPEFLLASVEVRNAFVKHKQYHMEQLGQLPEGMDYPEDAASQYVEEMNMGGVPQEGEMPPQGGGMPPQGMDLSALEEQMNQQLPLDE